MGTSGWSYFSSVNQTALENNLKSEGIEERTNAKIILLIITFHISPNLSEVKWGCSLSKELIHSLSSMRETSNCRLECTEH